MQACIQSPDSMWNQILTKPQLHDKKKTRGKHRPCSAGTHSMMMPCLPITQSCQLEATSKQLSKDTCRIQSVTRNFQATHCRASFAGYWALWLCPPPDLTTHTQAHIGSLRPLPPQCLFRQPSCLCPVLITATVSSDELSSCASVAWHPPFSNSFH